MISSRACERRSTPADEPASGARPRRSDRFASMDVEFALVDRRDPMKRLPFVLWASVGLVLPFAAHGGTPNAPAGIDPAAKAISGSEFLKTVTKLASDEFEGRSPSSKGEALTVNYLADTFKSLGLQPGNPDGTYFQKVPLLSYRTDPNAKLDVASQSGSMSLSLG